MGKRSLGSKLLVRPCYTKLFKLAVSLREEGLTKFVLTGTPGIGKSLWTVELLRLASSLGITVVLELVERGGMCQCFLLQPGEPVKKGSVDRFAPYLDDEDVLYIVDSQQAPSVCATWTIFITPPQREKYWSFLKEPDAGKKLLKTYMFVVCRNRHRSHPLCFAMGRSAVKVLISCLAKEVFCESMAQRNEAVNNA